jgi:Lrp/AsnC family leucine-responsive transcriptional regulator
MDDLHLALDDTDRRLLRLLQQDGRMTNVALAARANLSQAACFERVRRLSRAGVIQGYTVRLDAGKLDRALLIFVEITLDRTSARVFEDFAEAVRRTPDILECHMVAGGFDYLIKARVRDMVAYRAFLGDTLVALPGIRQTHTYTVMEEVKNTGDLPI